MLKKKICLIDDDRIYRFTVKHLLSDDLEEDNILEFEDGELALNGLTERLVKGEELPDVILVDVNMPHLNGWEFLEKFHERIRFKSSLPNFYLISSSNAVADIERAKTIPYLKGFLTKPLTKQDYLELLSA